MTRISRPGYGRFKFFQPGSFHHLLDQIGGQLIVDRDEQQVDVRRLHIIILFGTVDPLQVQQIDLGTAVPHEELQVVLFQDFFLLLPCGGEKVQIQSKRIVIKSDVLSVL